jgi:hypothetical protein
MLGNVLISSRIEPPPELLERVQEIAASQYRSGPLSSSLILS